jgi:hypothetical protein
MSTPSLVVTTDRTLPSRSILEDAQRGRARWVFRFEPNPQGTRAIAEILPFGDDALELQFASMFKDDRSLAIHMLLSFADNGLMALEFVTC